MERVVYLTASAIDPLNTRVVRMVRIELALGASSLHAHGRPRRTCADNMERIVVDSTSRARP